MKKYSFVPIAALMSLLFISGCSNDLVHETHIGDIVFRTYRSSLSEETKTYLHDGGKVDWEKGDIIRYYSSDNGNIGAFTIEENCHDAAIKVQMSKSDDYLVAVYGCDSIVNNEKNGCTITGVAETVQDGSFGSAHTSIARITDVTSNYLSFSTIVGLVQFTISSSDVSYIRFIADDGTNVTAGGGIDVSFSDSGITTRFDSPENGDCIKVNINGAGTYYLSTIPCSIGGFTIEFYNADDTKLGEVSTEKTLSLVAGRVVNLGTLDTRVEMEQYDYVIATDFADWSEACFGKNGEMIFFKSSSEEDKSGRTYMLLPSETNGLDEFYASFDENDEPEFVYINGMCIKILSMQDGLASVLVNFGDTLDVIMDSLVVTFDNDKTKSFSENNGVRNACAIALLALGAAEVGSGSALVVASGATVPETGIVGLAGIASGIYTVTNGVNDISGAYETLFSPATRSYSGNYTNMIIAGGKYTCEQTIDVILENYFNTNNNPELTVFKSGDAGQIKKANDIISMLSLGIKIIDNTFGRTITEFDRVLMNYQGFSVISGALKEKGTHWATVGSYIGPDPYSKSAYWESGLIINGSDGYHSTYRSNSYNYFETTFRGLDRGATYTYNAYFFDKEHELSFFGHPTSFLTKEAEPAKVTGFEQTGAVKGNYEYEGRTYEYKFSVTTTVTFDEDEIEEAADWGYVYKDPNGDITHISLKGHWSPYKDSRYVYYRDDAESTACLYGYVMYEDEYFYDEPCYYPLSYKNSCPDSSHVHAIDLGLSVKWASCNVGASSPEDYGGYYAWGETETKSVYNWDTYKYYHTVDTDGDGTNDRWYYDNIGDDISGTQYDVAHAKWGGSWRMPTSAEFYELLSNCERTGIRLTSKINGNSIILPRGGWISSDDNNTAAKNEENRRGYYWSSSRNTSTWHGAWCFRLEVFAEINDMPRIYGLPIRPVSE